MNRKVSRTRAFSLVELLIVVGLISIMISLVVIGSFKESNRLATGGNMTVDLMSQARQAARTRNTLTMLVMQNGGKDARRALSVYSFSVKDREWTQIDRWRILPTGIEINKELSDVFFTQPPAAALPLTRVGEEIDCLAAMFLPDGRVWTSASEPLVVQLNKTRGEVHDFYKIIVNQATGTPIVRRP